MRATAIFALAFGVGFMIPPPAEANIMCTWFGRCLYESPGFRITVVDKETGKPLPDVHALAEWVMEGRHGSDGPLIVQDAVSGRDGILTFPGWGPIRGPRTGLILNHDPVITLFKPGYKTLLIQNAYPEDTEETTRIRRFGQDGQTIAVEPFRGTSEEWVEELRKAAYPPRLGGVSQEQLLEFQVRYLNRRRMVWAELQKVSRDKREIANFIRAFEDSLRRLEELHR